MVYHSNDHYIVGIPSLCIGKIITINDLFCGIIYWDEWGLMIIGKLVINDDLALGFQHSEHRQQQLQSSSVDIVPPYGD